MTLRLPASQAAELEAVARADDVTVSEAARTAIQRHIEARRADEAFQARVRLMIEADREMLRRLVS